MNDAQIKHMVDRFLGWILLKDFNPDGGVSYKVPNYVGAALENHRLFGTNLLDATQAEAMVRYLVAGMPEDAAFERVEYADGSSAFGPAPLPRVSPDGAPAIEST